VIGAADEPSAAQGMEGASEDVFPEIGGTELEQHTAPAHPYDGADPELLAADGIGLGLCTLRALESEPAHRFHQRNSTPRPILWKSYFIPITFTLKYLN